VSKAFDKPIPVKLPVARVYGLVTYPETRIACGEPIHDSRGYEIIDSRGNAIIDD
jgi:hypothetical protein